MNSTLFLILPFTAFIAYALYFYLWKVGKYPKGPTPLPFLGNLLQFPSQHFQLHIDDLSKIYGPCFTIWTPLPIVVLADYEHVKEAFVTQPDAFTHRTHRPPENLLQAHDNVGVLISSGDVWRSQRRTSLKILRDLGLGKNLMEAHICRSINEMLGQLGHVAADQKNTDLFWPIQLCVGNVINQVLFGFHYSYKKPERVMKLVEVLDYQFKEMRSGASFMVMAWPWLRHLPIIGELGYHKLKRNIKQYQDFIVEECDKQKKVFNEDFEPDNFVHAYLKQMRKEEDLDMKNLYASMLDFWMAGMETTSGSLRWHIAYMMKYPEVQDKVREEIFNIVGASRLPAMSDKSRMPLTQAVIHEVQRHSNIIPILGTHACIEDVEVCGKAIPAGTPVFAQIYSVMRNDPVFEDPSIFNPSRFLMNDGKTFNKAALDRNIPFSIGKRACVGEGLARMELFLIFTALIQKYKFVPKSDIDLTPDYGAVLTVKNYKCEIISQF